MKIPILPQPDDVTCGPTSLHAVYRYWGLELDLSRVIRDVNSLKGGGTLATFLGIDALRRGFTAQLYSFNLKIFDPSWAYLDPAALVEKLETQLLYKKGKKLHATTRAYIQFLEQGGEMRFTDLTKGLLKGYFDAGQPVLAGLSATYLYRSKREYTNHKNRSIFDDLRGEPVGHFVILYGMTGTDVVVADPYLENPISGGHHYTVKVTRLINAIMLGTVTYDANLLIISPPNPP